MVRSFACRHLGAELRHASIRGALMEEAFTDKLKSALPAVDITYEDVKLALDFIHSFLKSNPSARVTAETGMKHKFLGQGDYVCNDVDALWQRPNPTSESIYGPTIYHHQIEAPTIRRRPTIYQPDSMDEEGYRWMDSRRTQITQSFSFQSVILGTEKA
ncbi:hypothetical protein HNY73_017118 [Argiope bruennichi]|uniref:Uncharacterized protein n=1 Tax=Argiope bruennichi TaxID=94029 RepID=A0A8T0EPK4_ARGBR|nr:hypothetical protein HNY73_017118 [Argiope bruennichi]